MKQENKFNWKLVIIALLVVTMVYFIASYVIDLSNQKERETLYCHFSKIMSNDSIPRNECSILKIVSTDIDAIDMKQFLKENKTFLPCSVSLDDLPACEGETYHFTQFTLRTFCKVRPCDIDGWICGAYYITYYDNNSINRQLYEELMFTEPNIESEEELMNKLDGCEI